MNIQQLEYILAVHKFQHFAIAAEHCNITQATLSAMIKKLEVELGALIFDRSRKPVKTTEYGIIFIERARQMIALKEELLSLKNEELELQGKLIIGIIPTIASSLLSLILPLFNKDHPKLKVQVLEITTEEIKHQLSTDKIDIGILATPINDESFKEHILYYEPMMVYGIKELKKKYITSADLKGEKMWLLEEGHCFRNQALTICDLRKTELQHSNLDFRGSSFDTMINLTNALGGLTLIPELYFNNLSENEQGMTKKFEKPIPVREISIITYRNHAKEKAVEYLTKRIKQVVEPYLSTHKYNKKDLEIIGI